MRVGGVFCVFSGFLFAVFRIRVPGDWLRVPAAIGDVPYSVSVFRIRVPGLLSVLYPLDWSAVIPARVSVSYPFKACLQWTCSRLVGPP